MYIHIPFCRHRCHYCDFVTTVGKEGLMSHYVEALVGELDEISKNQNRTELHSIYFGGGTPSLLPIASYTEIFTFIQKNFFLSEDCEVSLEANPGTLSLEYLQQLRNLGFTRLSIGMQSMNPFDLIRLDRIHTLEEGLRSVFDARKAGFDNLNLDLIFGLPWQNLDDWRNSLNLALTLQPEHFSLYSLIIEPGTELYFWNQKGLIAQQDQDLEGDMYAYAMRLLADRGYEQYEISNWRKRSQTRDYRCRHNLQYWRNLPYFGVGVGAHGYINGFRIENTNLLEEYIQRLLTTKAMEEEFPATAATSSLTEVDSDTQMKDFMMLGLRLIREGVTEQRFQESYHCSIKSVFGKEIEALQRFGLIAWTGRDKSRLRLTRRGIMVANQVFMQFV